MRPACAACGLDYAFADSGDGPAVFVMLYRGFLVVGAALFVEVPTSRRSGSTLIIWLPLTVVVCLGMLRAAEGRS